VVDRAQKSFKMHTDTLKLITSPKNEFRLSLFLLLMSNNDFTYFFSVFVFLVDEISQDFRGL